MEAIEETANTSLNPFAFRLCDGLPTAFIPPKFDLKELAVSGDEDRPVRKVQMVTDRELEILKVLWARGKASVREVQEDLNKVAGPVAYSTVQTLLNIMEDKKSLVRHVVEGRTFIYIPKKSSDRTIQELTHRFLDRVFDGAMDRMMVALLDTKPPSAEEFARLRAMLDEAQKQQESRVDQEVCTEKA